MLNGGVQHYRGGGMYWERCRQRFGVADEMWCMPRGVAEQGDQRDVFRTKH